MTTADLLARVEERFNRTGNPSLPPEETLKAILELGRELEEEKSTKFQYEDNMTALSGKLEEAKEQLSIEVKSREKAEDEARNQAWVAQELGNFVRGIANRQYEGTEVAAAQRVFDLNGSSLSKKRLNAYNYDSVKDAILGYRKARGLDPLAPENLNDFHEWLFSRVRL